MNDGEDNYIIFVTSDERINAHTIIRTARPVRSTVPGWVATIITPDPQTVNVSLESEKTPWAS